MATYVDVRQRTVTCGIVHACKLCARFPRRWRRT